VINAPIEEVFDAIVDCGNFASWNPTIRSSRRLDDRPPGDGAQFEWNLAGLGVVVMELQEFRRPDRVRINAPTGGHRFALTAQGRSTRVDHELEVRPKGAMIVMAPIMGLIGRKNLKDTAEALRKHLEK
jgi:uncharacterized protein YndB with AHSA1/START domain